MNVRLDYRHINYWQSAMGAHRVVGTGERLQVQEAQSQARPAEIESLPQRPSTGGSEPIRDSRRRAAMPSLPRRAFCPKIWRSQARE
jgi:hypothetical protein